VAGITAGSARVAGGPAEQEIMIRLRPVPSIQEGLLGRSCNERLGLLHERYVESVNIAVAEDDLRRVDRLAAEFDRDVARTLHPSA
jgi:hypothetical protein